MTTHAGKLNDEYTPPVATVTLTQVDARYLRRMLMTYRDLAPHIQEGARVRCDEVIDAIESREYCLPVDDLTQGIEAVRWQALQCGTQGNARGMNEMMQIVRSYELRVLTAVDARLQAVQDYHAEQARAAALSDRLAAAGLTPLGTIILIGAFSVLLLLAFLGSILQ